MVDPVNFTNFNRSLVELEEVALFSTLVAGKNAITTAKSLQTFLVYAHRKCVNPPIHGFRPFEAIRQFTLAELQQMLKDAGIGCHTSKSQSIHELVNSGLNLTTCTMDDLVNIHGIGYKTANLFLMHTRKNYKGCCLDTHILKYLRSLGHDVPKSTPQSKKRYLEIQKIYFSIAKVLGIDPTVLDLDIWRKYSGNAA